MKKIKIISLLFACLISGAVCFAADAKKSDASKKSDAQLRREYMQKDLATLKDLGEPRLSSRGSASIILFGDTQTYTPKMQNHGILDLMTSWTAVNIKKLNIKAVVGVGDIVEHNGSINTPAGSNQNYVQMWNAISRCFERLDNRVPCILSTGNHDYGGIWYQGQSSKGTSFFSKYFNPARNYLTQEALVEAYAPHNQVETLDNAFYKIDLGGKWGVWNFLVLEFDPRKEVLDWAVKLLSQPKYKESKVVLVTHSMIDFKNELKAKRIWETLVSKCPQIKTVWCGHECVNTTDFEQGVGYLEMKNDAGNIVPMMMFDPQTVGGGFGGNGGDGWLRILEFMPDGKTVKVFTYSPLFGISPMTKRLAWRTAKYDMFTITLH